MTATSQCVVVFITTPDMDTARRLASIVLNTRLAACANLVPGIESHYWWKDRLESSAEVLMILKTTRTSLTELEDCVRSAHPYEVPEFVVIPITDGSESYLDWLKAHVQVPDSINP